MDALELEMRAYKARADTQWALPEQERPELWAFWRAASLILPNWWIRVKEVALIMPSSCTVESAFSLSSQGMGDNQRSALEDYMCGSVIVRYNHLLEDKGEATV